jgi:hypothetical protein
MSTSSSSTSSSGGDDSLNNNDVLKDRIVNFTDWWSNVQQSTMPGRILDLRSIEDQNIRSLGPTTNTTSIKNLTVVPFPIENLKERSFELPARHIEFSILCSRNDLLEASSFLLGSKPNTRKRKLNPWKVTSVLLDEEDLWNQAMDLGIVCSSSTILTWPLPRLWQPDPMVEHVLFPFLKELTCDGKDTILDLAAGAGRDVTFLAEELVGAGRTDYRVVAIDHRYNDKETKIVDDFWKRRGIQDYTCSMKLNLSQLDAIEESSVSLSRVAAMYCVRFWKKELVQAIARSESVEKDVLFGLSHFCKPYPGSSWDFDHPSEKTVLDRNELSDIFSVQWDIVHDEIAMDSDHGRTMIHFVARKR